jgi:hypothetical protein
MNLDLSDEQAAALTKELDDIIRSDRYPFSPRVRTIKAILAKLRPERVREPLHPLKHYGPPLTPQPPKGDGGVSGSRGVDAVASDTTR